MGKILKYCSSCEEGFAERFTFCPDCGGALQAVQLNPVPEENQMVAAEPSATSVADHPEVLTAPFTAEPEPVITQPASEVSEALYDASSNGYATGPLDNDEIGEVPEVVEPVPATAPLGAAPVYQTAEMYADEPRRASETSVQRADDGGFYVTVIQDDDTKTRNALLMGASALVLVSAVVLGLVSMFQKDLGVGAVDDSPLFSAVLVEDIPMPVEDEEPQKANDDDDGGGGGGGKNEPTPASRGDLPDMVRNPIRPPDVNTPRLENPSLRLPPPQVEGPPRKFDRTYGQWGLPNGVDGPPSNGPGTGGGIGSGSGTGVGSGSGTGIGSGTGSGMGSGRGDGIGDGSGRGGGAPPPIKAAVTENYRIISKPKPPYTDAARTNQVQGRVLLKVTLLASGQVGSITPVQRLPHGLTESAIAAARQIRFTPKKVNGVAQSVIVTIDYGFNMY
jgi:protein TonB